MQNKTTMDIHQKTGMAIVQLRKEQGISQYNLAIKANITFRYLSDIENGKRNLSLNILEKIATALGVKVSKVFEIAEKLNKITDLHICSLCRSVNLCIFAPQNGNT